jgi:hypothetical protein
VVFLITARVNAIADSDGVMLTIISV